MSFKKMFLALATFAFIFSANNLLAQCSSNSAHNQKQQRAVNVSHKKDVVDIAISSDVHTTLVAAVKAANLVNTLKGDGPFTVFAPTNTAFDKLPDGTVETLLKPENEDALTKILTYHVVAGNFTAADVVSAIKYEGGTAKFKTVSGGTLKAFMNDGNVYLQDENGNRSAITAVDLKGSNGVVHVIDTVVLPK